MKYLLHHMLQNSANRTPDSEAIVDRDNRLSFADAVDRASSIAQRLRELGIQRGDRVAVFLKPEQDLPLTILAISMAGAAFVPIHHGLFPAQVAHIINDCQAAALVTDDKRLEKLAGNIVESPSLQFVAARGCIARNIDGVPVHDFNDFFKETGAPCNDLCVGKDLAAILYTSGSTGRPKGVMLSHDNILAGANIVATYLDLTGNDRLLAALPFSFDAGLNQLTTALLKGAATVMIDFRFGPDIVRKLVTEEITGLAGVPPLWSLLAQASSGLGKAPLPTLRYITNTGGVLPQPVLAHLQNTLPETEIFLMYGLTEAFRSTYLPPEELKHRPGSMGKAIPNTEIMVLNKTGEDCQPGEVGELVHHGPTVSMGYWAQPELTKKVLRPHPKTPPGQTSPDMVCYSGDLVKRDEDGFLYFVGRRDNQLKSAGFRISPTEVEEVICSAAPARLAAVVGMPDPVLGQALVAFVVPQDGTHVIDPAEVLSACAARLPRYMIPKRVIVRDNLPTTSSGKVNYPELRRNLETMQVDVDAKH
jgi:acyl-CoA ligase (AMP-forming) (exosortase A-associated)